MKDKHLTPKQKQVLEWIEQYLSHHQTLPSRREIAEGLGLSSPATVQQHIEALEEKGFIKRPEKKGAREIQWTAKGKRFNAKNIENNLNDRSAISGTAQNRATHATNYPEGTVHSLIRTNSPAAMNLSISDLRDQEVEIPLLGSIAAGYPIEVFTSEQSLNVHLSFFAQSPLGKLGEVFALKVRGDSMIEEGIFNGDVVILRKSDNPRNGDTVAALINGEATLKTLVKLKNSVELHPANPKYPVIPIRGEDRFEVQGVVVGLMRRYG